MPFCNQTNNGEKFWREAASQGVDPKKNPFPLGIQAPS